MANDWRACSFLGTPDRPWVLRTAFTADSYHISFTDLDCVWSESLDKQQIFRRAKDVSSEINPEDASSQMRILLEKIEACLNGSVGSASLLEQTEETLELVLHIPLPKPLKELAWRLHLYCLPQSGVKAQLIAPLVSLAYIQKQQIEYLTRCLTEKDNAIGKILDKIETLGSDFGTFFPTARLNKRGNQREQVVKGIRGLAPFDNATWSIESPDAVVTPVEPVTLLVEALKGSGGDRITKLAGLLENSNASSQSDNLRKTYNLAHKKDASGYRQFVPQTQSQNESQDDEFQRQATPERKKSSTTSPVSPSNFSTTRPANLTTAEIGEDDETTEDEDDLDAPVVSRGIVKPDNSEPGLPNKLSYRQSPAPGAANNENAEQLESSAIPAPKSTPKEPQKLGTIGSSPREASIDTRSPVASRVRRSGTDSPSDLEMENAPSPTESSSRPRPRKLGAIGSRRAAAGPEPDRSRASLSPISTTSASQTPWKRKLGQIRGPGASARITRSPSPKTKMSQTQEQIVESIEPTLPADVAQQEPEVEETAQEKADRKRDALMKDLQSTKPSNKKKRRF